MVCTSVDGAAGDAVTLIVVPGAAAARLELAAGGGAADDCAGGAALEGAAGGGAALDEAAGGGAGLFDEAGGAGVGDGGGACDEGAASAEDCGLEAAGAGEDGVGAAEGGSGEGVTDGKGGFDEAAGGGLDRAGLDAAGAIKEETNVLAVPLLLDMLATSARRTQRKSRALRQEWRRGDEDEGPEKRCRRAVRKVRMVVSRNAAGSVLGRALEGKGRRREDLGASPRVDPRVVMYGPGTCRPQKRGRLRVEWRRGGGAAESGVETGDEAIPSSTKRSQQPTVPGPPDVWLCAD